MRKHKVDEINIKIESVRPFEGATCNGIIISWYSDIGFGEYTLYKNHESNEWCADSETMDSNEDKEFITELMRLFIGQLTIK